MKKLVPLILLLLASPGSLFAHAQGEDYVFFKFLENSVEGLFEIHFDEFAEKLDLALEGTDEEALAIVERNAERVQAYLRENFRIGPKGGEPWALEFLAPEIFTLPQGRFVLYNFRIDTGPLPDELDVHHSLFYEGDRLHRGLLMMQYNAKTDTTYEGEYTAMVFSPGNRDQVLDLNNVGGLLTPWDMIPQGVLHIWIGIDHILFLLALMLPTVLQRKDGAWEPVESFKAALWNLLKIVTVFTIAHSVTLLLAALDFISLPSRLVESIIALSIVLVALNNIFPKVREGSLLIILGLGLFHGLGFASVMGHLPFRMVDILKTVVGFNIGVELGQIAIVAVLFPLLFAMRRTEAYRKWLLPVVSALLLLVAAWWFIERALAL